MSSLVDLLLSSRENAHHPKEFILPAGNEKAAHSNSARTSLRALGRGERIIRLALMPYNSENVCVRLCWFVRTGSSAASPFSPIFTLIVLPLLTAVSTGDSRLLQLPEFDILG